MRSIASTALVAFFTGLTLASAQEMTVVDTIDFVEADPEATEIAREMYGPDNPFVEAVAFWLVPSNSGEPQQIAVKMGSEGCKERCEIAVLYYSDDQWLEVWRSPGQELGVGVDNPGAGLRNLIDAEREWVWNGENYEPFPRGSYPESRPATEFELSDARIYLQGLGMLTPEAEVTPLGRSELPVDDGAGYVVFVAAPELQVQQMIPGVFFDADGEPIGFVNALDGDIRLAEGTDANGYALVEALTPRGVMVLAPSEDGASSARSMIGPQPVTRAGDPRPESDL